jgi:hypothetical protein
MMKHSVIYIPGLGDANPRGQLTLVRTWKWYGIEPHFFQMNWADGEPFAPKFDRLLLLIDGQKAKGNKVSLVAASAGAGAAINAFAARKDAINGVVCIAGKVNNADTIGENYRRQNPAFVESANLVQRSLDQLDFDTDRTRILSRYALFDPVVPREDSEIAGAHNHAVPSVGHSVTIALQLMFGAPSFLRFLKQP